MVYRYEDEKPGGVKVVEPESIVAYRISGLHSKTTAAMVSYEKAEHLLIELTAEDVRLNLGMERRFTVADDIEALKDEEYEDAWQINARIHEIWQNISWRQHVQEELPPYYLEQIEVDMQRTCTCASSHECGTSEKEGEDEDEEEDEEEEEA